MDNINNFEKQSLLGQKTSREPKPHSGESMKYLLNLNNILNRYRRSIRTFNRGLGRIKTFTRRK